MMNISKHGHDEDSIFSVGNRSNADLRAVIQDAVRAALDRYFGDAS
jgi:hypothetical protein